MGACRFTEAVRSEGNAACTLNWTFGLSEQQYGEKTDGKFCMSNLSRFDGHLMLLLEL